MDIRHAVAEIIGRRVEGFVPLVIDDDEQLVIVPTAENLLHQVLRQQLRAVDVHRLKFLTRTDVHHANVRPVAAPLGQVARLDQNAGILLVALANLFQHVGDGEIAIALANPGQCFLRLKPATAAPPDVVLAKQRPLCAGKNLQHRLHRGVACDGFAHSDKHFSDAVEHLDEAIDLGLGVVKVKTRTGGRRDTELGQERLIAMMTRPQRDALLVGHRG